ATLPLPTRRGQLGLVGSPAEFERAGASIGQSLASTRTVTVGAGDRELRMFAITPGTRISAVRGRVPGFNIRVFAPGDEVVIQATRAAWEEATGPLSREVG